jgi:hypothetical protein
MRWQRRVWSVFAAAALLWLPVASEAVLFVGGTKEHIICPGFGHSDDRFPFTLEIEPGFALGTLTYAGTPAIEVVAQWTADGQGAAFTATGIEPNGGPIVMYGWTRGAKMKGWIVAQSYGDDGCIYHGTLKAWAQ